MVRPNASELEEEGVEVYRIVACEVLLSSKKVCHFAPKSYTKEVVSPAKVKRMLEPDFSEEQTEGPPLSYDDKFLFSL